MSNRRVVITGLGPVTPIGSGATEFWNGLIDKKCGIRRIREFDPSGFDSQVGGEIDGVKIGSFVPKSYRKAGKIMARDIVLAVAAAYHAAVDADLHTRCLVERGEAPEVNVDSTRLGVNIGAGLICADLAELAEALHAGVEDGHFSLARWGAEAMNNLTPLWLLKFLPNMLACHVTIVHDARGPSNTITCGEASSHLAIGEAFRTIQRGTADVSLCGGAESKDNPMALIRQSLVGRLTHRNDAPGQACRPFGQDRDGTAISEGGAVIVLEELEHAKARGARIYAEVAGFGLASDAYKPGTVGAPAPDGRGIVLAASKALRDAGIRADQIDMVSAFAAGLPEHDAAEARAIRTILGDRTGAVPVLAVKAGLGNNGAGSGAIDFAAAVLAMQRGVIAPAFNSAPPDPDFGLKLVTQDPVDAPIDVALCNAYALGGGQNASLVIRRVRD